MLPNFVIVLTKLVINPLNMIIGGLFLAEAIKFPKIMEKEQASRNVLSMVSIVLFSIDWPWIPGILHITFALLPFLLNLLDIAHLPKEEKVFAVLNKWETFLSFTLIGMSIFLTIFKGW